MAMTRDPLRHETTQSALLARKSFACVCSGNAFVTNHEAGERELHEHLQGSVKHHLYTCAVEFLEISPLFRM
jgi:hypothetical protein